MARHQNTWTEELFHKHVVFIDKSILFNRLKESVETGSEEFEEIELDKNYVITQDLFGVKIENGSLRISQIIMDDVLNMLNSMVEIVNVKRGVELRPIENIDTIIGLAKQWGLEEPDKEAIQGYILNKEMVRIDNTDHTTIVVKYKDNPDNIFYIYKFYFVEIDNSMYLVIEKNI
jgi:hypothetical protein